VNLEASGNARKDRPVMVAVGGPDEAALAARIEVVLAQ
jgi:hypothetical protein